MFSTTGVRTQHQRLVVEGEHSVWQCLSGLQSHIKLHQRLVLKARIFTESVSFPLMSEVLKSCGLVAPCLNGIPAFLSCSWLLLRQSKEYLS